MIKAFFLSRKWFFWAYGGGILLIILLWAQVQLSVKFNDWYGRFYDILGKASQHTVADFYSSLLEWVYLVIPYILIIATVNFLTRHYALRWRKAITFDYLPRWQLVEQRIEGASQRIQEDAREFAEIIESLGLRAVRATMTLIAFLPILWNLSRGVKINMLESIPGSLVWVALVTTLGGIAISWFVGGYLPKLEYNNQLVEAAFRKELVLSEDDRMRRATLETFVGLFTGIQFNYSRLYLHYGYFDLWGNFYDVAILLIPDVVMGPNLFTGVITLGVLMQVNNAFLKVWGSFSFVIDNWTRITKLRSVWIRLHEFEATLSKQ